MATPSLHNLKEHFPEAQYTLVSSKPVAELFQNDPRFQVVVDTSKKDPIRLCGIRQMSAMVGSFDIAITFRNSVACTLFIYWTNSKRTVGAANWHRTWLFSDSISITTSLHQAAIYNQIINKFLHTNYPTGKTELYLKAPTTYPRKTLGLAPGATYGDAKRWPSDRFAQVAMHFAKDYDILLFGSALEKNAAFEIETMLRSQGIKNFQNLVGQTTVSDLVTKIAGLSLFITNDSGPMHIAGAFQIPTVAIFGPTIAQQTCPWQHEHLIMLRKPIPCAPCMKRTCPYGHHQCMTQITPEEVIAAAAELSTGTAASQLH